MNFSALTLNWFRPPDSSVSVIIESPKFKTKDLETGTKKTRRISEGQVRQSVFDYQNEPVDKKMSLWGVKADRLLLTAILVRERWRTPLKHLSAILSYFLTSISALYKSLIFSEFENPTFWYSVILSFWILISRLPGVSEAKISYDLIGKTLFLFKFT